MSVLALVLVLTAACLHATWNLLIKQVKGGPELSWLIAVVSVVLYLPPAVVILILEKPYIGVWEVGFMAGAAVLHTAYFLVLQQGYRTGDLSVVYPTARATGPVLSTAFAVAFLGERLSPQIFSGGLAIVLGVLFLTRGGNKPADRLPRSLLFGVATGLLIGSYTVWDAYAVKTLLVPPLVLDFGINVGRTFILSPYLLTRPGEIRRLWRDHWKTIVAVALFSPLAFILVLIAMTFTPVVYVAPLRETSVLIAVLAGSLFLGEGHLKKRLIWASVILAGMILLSTG